MIPFSIYLTEQQNSHSTFRPTACSVHLNIYTADSRI